MEPPRFGMSRTTSHYKQIFDLVYLGLPPDRVQPVVPSQYDVHKLLPKPGLDLTNNKFLTRSKCGYSGLKHCLLLLFRAQAFEHASYWACRHRST